MRCCSRPAPAPTAAPLPAFLQKRDDKARDPDDDVMKAIHESNRPDKWLTALYRHIVKKLKDKETAGNKVGQLFASQLSGWCKCSARLTRFFFILGHGARGVAAPSSCTEAPAGAVSSFADATHGGTEHSRFYDCGRASHHMRATVGQAFHSFYLACHIMSQAKRKCIKWIVVLLTTPAHTRGGWSPDSTMTQQWILSFPQILWKLQDKNTTTTQVGTST